MSESLSNLVGGLIQFVAVMAVLVGSVAFYFLPTIVARKRFHHNATAITVLNVVGGWTILGWVVALVWAFTEVREG